MHPGADWAVSDVYDGLVPALRALGVTCIPFELSQRISVAASWLYHAWTMGGEKPPKPNDADVAYQAGSGILERALRHNVDWVLIFSGMYFHPDLMILLRRAHIKAGLILTESPYEDESEMKILRWVEVGWTNERTCVERYREVNYSVNYLPAAYDPYRFATSEIEGVNSHDVVFVGTSFPKRVELLEAVDWSGINLGLYGLWDEVLADNSPLKPFVRAGVTQPAATLALYKRAKIGLNLYRSDRSFDGSRGPIVGAESLNPRALELAASGTFQLSEQRAEIDEVFGNTVPTFTGAEDLNKKIRYYLSDSGAEEAKELALASKRKLIGHSFHERAVQILCDIGAIRNGEI